MSYDGVLKAAAWTVYHGRNLSDGDLRFVACHRARQKFSKIHRGNGENGDESRDEKRQNECSG